MYNRKGWTQMASYAKTRSEAESNRVNYYDHQIELIEKEIDRLWKISSIGLQKGTNYAKMKVMV